MLEHDARVDKVDVAVRKQPKMCTVIDDELTASDALVPAARQVHHAWRDVDPVTPSEVRRHRACQAPHPASEVERAFPSSGVPELARFLQHFFKLGLARSEELSEVPFAVTLV